MKIEKKDFLEFENLNYQIDIEKLNLKYNNLMLILNELKVKYHESEAKCNQQLAVLTINERQTIENSLDTNKNKIKEKEIALEEFVEELEKKKNLDLRDSTINPKTLEIKKITN